MKVDTSLPASGKNDFIILEEEYFNKGLLQGLINQGGSINIGNFAILFDVVNNGDLYFRMELRYVPKGKWHKPESFIKRKKKPSKATKVGEVIL